MDSNGVTYVGVVVLENKLRVLQRDVLQLNSRLSVCHWLLVATNAAWAFAVTLMLLAR